MWKSGGNREEKRRGGGRAEVTVRCRGEAGHRPQAQERQHFHFKGVGMGQGRETRLGGLGEAGGKTSALLGRTRWSTGCEERHGVGATRWKVEKEEQALRR